MKRLLLVLVVLSSLLAACTQQRKSPHESVAGGNVSVTYGRPAKNDRDIFGALVPFGQVWRAGADEATEITFTADGSLGGKPVKAGTYSLFVIPHEKEWEIILNSELKQWGAYEYEKFRSKNVLEVKTPVTSIDEPVETFTIRFEGGQMIMEWDKTRAIVPVS